MSGTLTVKEFIKELLEFDMNDSVFIAHGKNAMKPDGSSEICHLVLNDRHLTENTPYGVYINPSDNLKFED